MEPRDQFRPSGSPTSGGSTQRDAGQMANDLKEQAKGVADQAREGASRLAGKAREQAQRAVEERKGQAASSLDSLSSVLRDSAGRLRGEQSFFGDYAESAAERVDRLARYLRESDPEKFVRDAEDFARRRPEVFMGGMLVAGLLLARFLKSSSPEATDNDFVYAGGGSSSRGTGGSGSMSAGERRADVDTSWQPESGAYGGGTQRPNSPPAGTPNTSTDRGLDLAPDDETDLGL